MSREKDVTGNSWFLQDDDGQYAILLVKDIVEFRSALVGCMKLSTSKRLREHLDEVVDLVEFGPVTIQRNGTVKWLSGDFA